MADYNQIMTALRNADAAGDHEAASRLAQMAQEAKTKERPFDLGKAIKSGFADTGNTVDTYLTQLGTAPLAYINRDEADKSYKALDERIASRNQWANPEQDELKFGEKLTGAVANLPGQMLSFALSPATTGKTAIDAGESLPNALKATGIDTLGNTVGAAFGPMGNSLKAKILSSAAVNAGQEHATKAAIQSMMETEKGKKTFAPNLEDDLIAGIVGGGFGAHSFRQDQKASVRPSLLDAIQEQKYENPNTTDPLTKGASPNVAPWEKTKGQLDLGLGDTLGLKNEQIGYYESGLHPDEYLRRGGVERTVNETGPDTYSQLQNNPQPGQGDLFAGNRPYTPEELPAQQAAGRDAVARAAALEQALEVHPPELVNPAGPEIGAPKPQLEMPSVEYDRFSTQDPRVIERQIEELQRQREILRTAIDYKEPITESKYQAKQRIKEQELPPGYEQMPEIDKLRWTKLEDQRIQERLLELENLKRQVAKDSIPFDNGMRIEPNSAAPKTPEARFKYEGGLEYDKPNGLNNQLPLNETQQRNIRPDEISTKLNNEPTQGKLDFPTADGSGIVKMGNGGYIDWKATANGLRTMIKAGDRMIRVVGSHLKLNDGPHGVMRLSLLDGDKRLGEIDLSPKQRFDPIDGKENPLVANVHLVPEARGKGITSDMYKWIAANIGDLVQNKGSTREGGQKLWASLERNGVAKEGRITSEQKEKSPYDDHIINMANGGFINPEWQKKVTDFVKESIMGKARNTVEGTTEQARFMSLDHRSAAEVIAKIDPETVQDLGEKSRIAMNVMDTYGAVRVAREFKGSGEVIKWYADQSKIIDRSKEFVLENLLKGTEFVKSLRGFEFRKFSDKSPVRLMQTAIKSDWEGTRDMLKTWFEASRDGVEPSFKNPKHKEIYDPWQTVFDYTRNHMNVLREQNGLPPIPRQTAYFPLMRMGDYRVVASDANGNMLGAWHFNTVWEARAFKKALAGELPTLQITDPTHLKRSKYDYAIGDFTALEAANAALKHNPDILAQVTKAYAEATMRKGFGGKHSIESRHILGAMGLDYSRKGTVDALKAFEMYTERSMDYIAGLQKRQKMAEMLKAIADRKELQGKMDNTLAHLTDMFNFQRDALKDWAKGASEILDFVSRKSGFGEQGMARGTREFSGLATSWFLSTSSFLLSQPVQWVTGLSGLHTANGGGLVGAGLTVKNVFNGLAMTFFPDQLGKEGISFASKFGSISPETAEMYGARHIMNGDTILQELINNPGKSYLRGFSTVTQALEKHTVRIPYFLMQLDALKGQIKNKDVLFETAAHNTDRYMVDYSKNQQSMIYQRLGNLGSGLRPLKTFSNNLLGQFAEYALEAKHGNVGPMAIMLGTSVLLAGLAGNMVAQTVDDIIRGLNVIWPSANLPTLHETVMEMDSKNRMGKTAKSVAQFGVTSTILGYDVSSSVAQNSLKSFFTIPAAGLPIDMSWELGKYLVKDWQNKATEADKMKAYLALTPPSLKEYMRNQFVKNGAVPNPNAEMKLEYQRGPEEQAANEGFFSMQNLISRPSLNEARARAINRAASENLREQALDKKSAANVLADSIIENKEVTPEMMQNYIKEGGDPRRIVPMIRMRMMDRIFTEIEQREMKKGVSGAAGREKIQKEIEATHGIQKQSLSDDKSDAKGNVGSALPFNQLGAQLQQLPDVKQVEGPKIRGADKRRFFYDMPAERVKRHQELMGAI